MGTQLPQDGHTKSERHPRPNTVIQSPQINEAETQPILQASLRHTTDEAERVSRIAMQRDPQGKLNSNIITFHLYIIIT